MSNYRKLQHTEWDCKYHVILIPKYRRKVLYGTIREPPERNSTSVKQPAPRRAPAA